MNRITSLANHKFRILGLVISGIAILLFIVLKILNFEYEESWHDRIFILNHFIIIMGFFMIVYSKEVFDDDRVQKIRYGMLKWSYALTISVILAYVGVTTLDRFQFSAYVILYIIEIVLILYLVLFRVLLLKNPEWVFKQKTINKFRFYLLSLCLFFLIGWIIYCVIQCKI